MCVHLSRKNKLCLFTCLGRRALEHTLPPIMQLCQSQLPSVFTHTLEHTLPPIMHMSEPVT